MISAFNEQHRSPRARFAPLYVSSSTSVLGIQQNPRVSAVVGSQQMGTDLTAEWQGTNLDASALLPGVLAASTGTDGKIRGVPVDLEPYAAFYTAQQFAAADIAAPRATWSTDAFVALCAAMAKKGGGFGSGLGRGQMPNLTWLGFVEGYGGQAVSGGRLVLTAPSVLRGLTTFADVLQITWNRPWSHNTPLSLSITSYNATTGTSLMPGTVARFPRAPIPVVPAVLLHAYVPPTAPQPQAGAAFATWLISRAGQKALTSIGFPAMRTDLAGGMSWFSKGEAAVGAGNLRFAPSELAALVPINFASRLYNVLMMFSAARLTALRTLEQVANAVISGATNATAASAQLNRAGITAQ